MMRIGEDRMRQGLTTPIVRVQHGSHLYGTSTADSDLDYKGVHLPSAQRIILQRAEDVITNNTKTNTTGKNQPGDVDEQSYSLQKFFGMLSAGDTVATEILFAPAPFILAEDAMWSDLREIGRSLINRQCKGFVGYCRRQAAKYGIKGSRMAAVRRLLDILDAEVTLGNGLRKLATIDGVLQQFAQDEEHADWVNIPSPNGTDLWHIECCDRKMPMTTAIGEAHKVYSTVWDNYGDRARAAMNNEGIDWKAVSHAVRVAEQAIELLSTGHITFPRPNAPELLLIKQGALRYSNVSAQLEQLVEEVEQVAMTSNLPEKSDQALIDRVVTDYYLRQIQ